MKKKIKIHNYIADPSSLYRLLCETEDLRPVMNGICHLVDYKNQLTYEDNTKEYKGQTVLHIAIARGTEEPFILEIILGKINEKQLEYLLCKCATGTSPNYVSLLGETPLAAALIDEVINGQTGHFSLLLYHGADIKQINSKGDNILHSIVRITKLTDMNVPEILDEILASGVIEMYPGKLEDCSRMPNGEYCTPLQLAFKLSAVSMVHWLIQKFHQRQIFVNGNSHIEAFNITELDTVTNRIVSATPKNGDDTKRGCEDWSYERTRKPHMPSGLEMMFANNFSSDDALDMMDIKCVKFLVKEKWKQERLIFFLFGIVYFVSLLLITVYSIYRKDANLSNISTVSQSSIHNLDPNKFSNFSKSLLYLSTVISILALVLCATMLIGRLILRPNPLSQMIHNIDYSVMFIAFAIMLFLDCLLVIIKINHEFEYNGELLLVSIVFGWSFSTMFLRISISLGHLIDLLRQVINTHIISFLCITAIINIAFAACFFDLMRYVEDENGNVTENENFQSFWRTMYTMFTVTLGLNELEAIFNSRNSWFTILLFIIFMIIVYLLILNFLIAVMTETCTRIFSRRNEQTTLHRLSSMLFIEDMFLLPVLFLSPLHTLRVKGVRKHGGKQTPDDRPDESDKATGNSSDREGESESEKETNDSNDRNQDGESKSDKSTGTSNEMNQEGESKPNKSVDNSNDKNQEGSDCSGRSNKIGDVTSCSYVPSFELCFRRNMMSLAWGKKR